MKREQPNGKTQQETQTMDTGRLALLDTISLKRGSHVSFDDGVCVMEAAAYVAGEAHSDHPACVSGVIGVFMRSWNDSLRTDEDRDRLLKPLVLTIIGTRSTAEDDRVRSWMAMDWLVREYLPTWLDLIAGQAPRDIDVRVMVPEEEFRRRFPGTDVDRRHVCEQWRAQMLVWSEYGRQLTGLPIDFQVEPEEEANNRYGRQPRQPIGARLESPRPHVLEDTDDDPAA